MSGNCAAQGNSSAGSVTQLVAVGALNQYLNGNATYTIWRSKYTKHTNFAMEQASQPFQTAVMFGAEAQITLNRTGDLIHQMYVVIDLPGITACESDDIGRCGIMPSFPRCAGAAQCNPCRDADADVYHDFVHTNSARNLNEALQQAEGATPSLENAGLSERIFNLGKARYMKDTYGACAPVRHGACSPGGDCAGVKMLDVHPPVEGGAPTQGSYAVEEAAYAYWANSIGQLLIRTARIIIGGSTIDQLYSDFLFMYEELSGQPGKRLQEMVGKRHSKAALIADSRQARRLYVPLPFWFSQHTGNALSLTSLQFHGVQISVHFEALEKLISTGGGSGGGKPIQVLNCQTGCCVAATDLKAHMLTTYVYLDTKERQLFATSQFEQLITQVQATTVRTNSEQLRLNINFNHPVIELIWAVRRDCNAKCNSWFNYSGINNKDPMVSACLSLNNQTRFSDLASFFRLVQPYQAHTNIPSGYVYCYSFAVTPEDTLTPSGACNFSRIDNVEMSVELQPGITNGGESVTFILFGRNWNIVRYRDGLLGLAFSN